MKKTLCVWICAMMVLCMMPFAVSAAPSVRMTIAEVGAVPGKEITIPVAFSEVENMTAVDAHLEFDAAKLEFVKGTAVGCVAEMGMASATEPQSATGEVWLSAMDLNGVSGSGEGFLLTFKVKDTASGEAFVRFKSDYTHMLLIGADMTEAAVETVDGVVKFAGEAVVPSTTTATDAPTSTEGTLVAVDEQGAPITRQDGATVTVAAAEAVVDLQGAVVTDQNGKELRLPSVAVMVDQLTAEPEEEVTVQVSLSAVADLSSLEIGLTYNKKALEFIKGEGVGFVGDRLRVLETEQGLLLQAEHAARMSGSGAVANLTFRVTDRARAMSYRLGLDPSPRLLIDTTLLAVQPFAGEIRVLSDGANAGAESAPWLWIAVGGAAVVIVGVAVALMLRRKSGGTTPKNKRVTDVSGDE